MNGLQHECQRNRYNTKNGDENMDHIMQPMKIAHMLTNREHIENLVMLVEDLSPGMQSSSVRVGSIEIHADDYESYTISEKGSVIWEDVFDAQNVVELACLAHIARLTINTRRDAEELRVVEKMRDQLGGFTAAMWSMAIPEPGHANPSGRTLGLTTSDISDAQARAEFHGGRA